MSVDQRRTALVEAAYRVIADHGVEGATTRRICAHAGMPLASFHYAFESRTALLSAVMEKVVPQDITSMLDAILPETDNTDLGPDAMRANMRSQLQAFFEILKADPGRMQATISLGIYAHNHPELQRVGREMYQKLYTVAASGLDVAARRSGVEWAKPTAEFAPLVIGTTNAATIIYLSTADDAAIATIIDALIRELMTYLVVS